MTSRKVGRGQVIYLGTYLTVALVEVLADQVLSPAGVLPLVPDLPEGVEVTIREATNRRLMFILNTIGEPAIVNGVPAGMDLLSGVELSGGKLALPAYGCCIIELD
jgi:beta-galactosidase